MFSNTPPQSPPSRPFVPDSHEDLLGLPERPGHPRARKPFLVRWLGRRRRRRFIYATLVAASVLPVLLFYFPALQFWRSGHFLKVVWPLTLPPLYAVSRAREAALPQHLTVDPFAGGRKFLWIAGHDWGYGWGNIMQEIVMNAHLSYVTGRAYVFDHYTWNREGPEYSFFGLNIIPSRIPLSTLLSGPVVGGPFADGDVSPRAVSRQYWEKICPHPTIINAEDLRALHGNEVSALKIIETWRDYLANIDDPCVEVARESGNVFDRYMFGHPDQVLPAWPTFRQSPILTMWAWSDLVRSALEGNRELFSPAPLELEQSHTVDHDPHAPIAGLLAMHIRRGDYSRHCPRLSRWGSAFNAFNSFPELPDPWDAPHGTEEESLAVYLRRCYPTIELIVEKVEAVRRTSSGEGLKNIYIMTNGDRAWLKELKSALRRAYGWEHIVTSRDMVWTPEQKFVSQATDMLIGQRAQVLIGNGFSSMTSNIAMLRMAKGLHPNTTRMW